MFTGVTTNWEGRSVSGWSDWLGDEFEMLEFVPDILVTAVKIAPSDKSASIMGTFILEFTYLVQASRVGK